MLDSLLMGLTFGWKLLLNVFTRHEVFVIVCITVYIMILLSLFSYKTRCLQIWLLDDILIRRWGDGLVKAQKLKATQ